MMLINGFLGEVVGLATMLNEFSYNIALYGEPDLQAPWGWQLYGHHCAVNCLVVEGRMVRVAGLPRRRAQRDRRWPARRHRVLRRADRPRHGADGRADRRATRARPRSTSRWSTRPCRRAGCTPATSGTWPARSRTTGSSRSRACGSPTCRPPRRKLALAIAEQFAAAAAGGSARGAASARSREHLAGDLVLLDRRAPAGATSSTTDCSRR